MGLCHSTAERSRRNDAAPGERRRSGRPKKQRELKSRDIDARIGHVAGRMVMNGASEVACLHTQQGKKGINQDAMLVWENFSSRNDTILCGVFDGHGPFGHMVAKKVRDTLPFMLNSHWNSASESQESGFAKASRLEENGGNENGSIDDQCCEAQPGEDSKKLPEMYRCLKRALLKACLQMDKELKLHPAIDCFCSGTTAVALIKQNNDLVVGNIGDSRAVLATKDQDNSLIAVQLTVDLKPDLPREAARIQKCKGRVFALQDEPEVVRVWLPNSNSPGLAMARAFGDFCLKDFGLISVPDVYYHRLTEKDQFVILATDGVWDVLSNKEAVEIVASAPSRATAARALVGTAVRAWRLKYPTSKIDDCAVVCLFLEHSSVAPEGCNSRPQIHEETAEKTVATVEEKNGDNHVSCLEHPSGVRGEDEIVPVSELNDVNAPKSCRVECRRTLAEFILAGDDDEWSALEGLTRVNSLLSIPRFVSGELRSASWRKWW